ncbi:phenazine biosynthesis protein PhzF [Polymorphobacter multimanifer]|uniref:PhzF family phenazine biosynthesis protein n=1 Tax=Polymorphobacter multimanifer TaxID=1070431 RepID=UPI00166873C0|nr:PhzF family phenazine biosynthesis protein [Polymorphobacter multimanifer]GGI72195.1 phenazine biosynthesis protein PhzF [Polymorphobacter multimanifer]
MARAFSLVDVFGNGALGGNPLVVVHDAEALGDAEMLQLPRWLSVSETSFLLPPTDAGADYRVRIFTPDRELPFAGHPTLGSAHAWLAAGGVPRLGGELVQECGVGLVPLRVADGLIGFAAPPLLREGPVDDADRDDVLALLGIEGADVLDMAWADNGPGWIAVRLASAEAVLALAPARSWPRRIEGGVVGAHPAGGEVAFEIRTFFTYQALVVREDPVTGSMSGAAAQWQVAQGLGGGCWRAAQGQAMAHDGVVRLDAREAGRLWVSGACRTIVQGALSGDACVLNHPAA